MDECLDQIPMITNSAHAYVDDSELERVLQVGFMLRTENSEAARDEAFELAHRILDLVVVA